jgi:hypothetical protein
MPYHIGEKGSNGCSGYPVVSDKGHVAGCHPTEAAATNQLQALYANVEDASKADAASVTTSDAPENPSSHLNPEVGMKHPQICTPDSKACNDKMCKVCMKKIFSDFGKDYSKSTKIVDIK